MSYAIWSSTACDAEIGIFDAPKAGVTRSNRVGRTK